MSNIKLQEFVTNAAARGRLTFGDVRRLARDYLPGGVSTCEEAELLIGLEGKLVRADRAWADWLVTALVDFAVLNEQPVDEIGTGAREWLKGLLNAKGISTKATRRVAREIRRDAAPIEPMASFQAEPIGFQAEPIGAVARTVVLDAGAYPKSLLPLAA
jgi:hypothetical protein